MSAPPRHTRSRAFTLVEIMLATTLLALVMTIVLGIWSTSLTGWKRGMAVTEDLQRGRVVLDALTELASAMVFSPANQGLYEVRGTTDLNQGSKVSFVTASEYLLLPGEAGIAGLRRVTLALDRDPRGKLYLALTSGPALDAEAGDVEPFRRAISADVIFFRVRYRDPRDTAWSDEWRHPNLLPSAVEFTVAFGTGDRKVAPVIITRAVDVPAAKYVLATAGLALNTQSTTNEVLLPDVDLSALEESPDTETE